MKKQFTIEAEAADIKPIIIKAKDYSSRVDIEAAVINLIGRDINKNLESLHRIQGTKKDLKRLFLSESTNIWGVKVKQNG